MVPLDYYQQCQVLIRIGIHSCVFFNIFCWPVEAGDDGGYGCMTKLIFQNRMVKQTPIDVRHSCIRCARPSTRVQMWDAIFLSCYLFQQHCSRKIRLLSMHIQDKGLLTADFPFQPGHASLFLLCIGNKYLLYHMASLTTSLMNSFVQDQDKSLYPFSQSFQSLNEFPLLILKFFKDILKIITPVSVSIHVTLRAPPNSNLIKIISKDRIIY